MREEQLIDAIGKLDSEMFDEIAKLRVESTVKTADIVPIRTKKRSMRRWLVPVAACLVLMLGGFAAYASGALDGLIHFGTDDDGNKMVVFTPPENHYVPVSELSADVQNMTVQMSDRLQYYLAGEPLPNDEMIGMCTVDGNGISWNPPGDDVLEETHFIGYEDGERPNLPYAFNVGLPGRIYKPFDSIAAAEAFIGYAGLHMPALNETPLQLGVLVEGVNEGGLLNATPDSEFEIYSVGLFASYRFNNYTVVTSARIDTANQEGPLTTTIMNSANAVLSSETRTVGGREFTVITYLPESNLGFVKSVILVENRVTYTFELTGVGDESSETVEQFITDWMNSFPSIQ
ncbi:MAG: hypothetical protein J5738_00530 [Lachnospiraceae bacterium]|nr:hypothetical protein [Lachnospiraceae bacterium]